MAVTVRGCVYTVYLEWDEITAPGGKLVKALSTRRQDMATAAPLVFGIAFGVLSSVIFDLWYIVVFHEGSSEFYLFAGLAFLVGPFLGGLLTAIGTRENRHKAIALAGSAAAVLVVVIILFGLSYVVLPLFSYARVQIPAACIADASRSISHLPSERNYAVPGAGTGTLIASDAESAVVAMIDYAHSPWPSTVYLVSTSDRQVLGSMHFDNDFISAAYSPGLLVLFNDKIGYFIDPSTGQSVENLMTIDNYRGVFEAGQATYMQTTGTLSMLYSDGKVLSHVPLALSGIAFGCFIQ